MWVTAEEREIVKTPVGNEIPTKAPPRLLTCIPQQRAGSEQPWGTVPSVSYGRGEGDS